MNKIKKDDMVIVITGKDKGKSGQVLDINTKDHKIIVKGVNIVKKHQKAGRTKGVTESAIIERENWIDVSNVMLSVDGKATRVGFKLDGDKKVRVAKKTGKVIK